MGPPTGKSKNGLPQNSVGPKDGLWNVRISPDDLDIFNNMIIDGSFKKVVF